MAASPEQVAMQKKLAITPKTASLLMRLGYTNYKDLHAVSPNHVVSRLKTLPGMTASQADAYRRGLRRMVWLSTQPDPEAQAKRYPDWTQKALTARGVWREGYDDLTGDEAVAWQKEVEDAARSPETIRLDDSESSKYGGS